MQSLEAWAFMRCRWPHMKESEFISWLLYTWWLYMADWSQVLVLFSILILVSWLLIVISWLLFADCWLLYFVYLIVFCYLLFADCWLLIVYTWLVSGAGSLLHPHPPLVLQDPALHARLGRPLSSETFTMFDADKDDIVMIKMIKWWQLWGLS